MFGQKYLTKVLSILNLLWVCMGIFQTTGLWESCLGIISLPQIGLTGGIKQEAFHLVVKMYIALLLNFQAELSEPESFTSHPTFVNYMSFNCATVTILNCLSYNIMSERNTLVIWLAMWEGVPAVFIVNRSETLPAGSAMPSMRALGRPVGRLKL